MSIAENVSYSELVRRVLEFVLRAAVSRAGDQFAWEEEELRRQGLHRIEFACSGRALWWDASAYGAEESEAKREGARRRFASENALDLQFFEKLDVDLRERLCRAGYSTPSLLADMKELFVEIAAEVADRSARARDALIGEIVGTG